MSDPEAITRISGLIVACTPLLGLIGAATWRVWTTIDARRTAAAAAAAGSSTAAPADGSGTGSGTDEAPIPQGQPIPLAEAAQTPLEEFLNRRIGELDSEVDDLQADLRRVTAERDDARLELARRLGWTLPGTDTALRDPPTTSRPTSTPPTSSPPTSTAPPQETP